MSPDETIQKARAQFPRGLIQPERFRFSIDALLLAAFALPRLPARRQTGAWYPQAATERKEYHIMDLGTGCGVVGLALLLHAQLLSARGSIRVTGIERAPEMLDAAHANAALLGMENEFKALDADFSLPEGLEHARTAAGKNCKLLLANPPYLAQGNRLPTSTLRCQAMMDEGALALFSRTAWQLLERHGWFCCIVHAQRCTDMARLMLDQGFALSRLRMVHPQADANARFALLEGRKQAQAQLVVENPLFLHEALPPIALSTSPKRAYTPSALLFCPFLNAAP